MNWIRNRIMTEEKRSSLEGGGLRSASGVKRRVFTRALNRLRSLIQAPIGHLSLRRLAEYSPQGEMNDKSSLEGGGLRNESVAGRRVFGIGLLTIILIFISIPVHSQSIQDYQQMAAENNPEVRAAFHRYLATLEEGARIGALPDPELAFGYFISPIETRVGPQQARISLSQMFPWFGTLSDRRDLSASKAMAEFEQFQERRNRLFFEVEQAYLKLYEIDKSITIAEENLEILNSLVDISLGRYETDQATQVDVLRSQIEQEDLKTQIALLEDDRRVIVQEMNAFMNRADDASITPTDTLTADLSLINEDALTKQMARQNPALNRLRYKKESARDMKSLAENDGKPSFGIGFDYMFTGERTDVTGLTDNGRDAMMARVSLKIPLFRKKYSAGVRQAELNIRSAEYAIEGRKNQLETDLSASLRDLKDAARRYELYDQKQIQRVNQALSVMMQRYSTDSSNFEEILRMQRKQLEYRLSRIRALVDMKVAGAYIDYLTGKNNVDMSRES